MKHIQYDTDEKYGSTWERYLYAFENAWGASVVRGKYSYGGDEGLWELAVTHGWGTDMEHLCYQSPLTGDVIGHLEWWQVEDVLETLAQLPYADPSECPDLNSLTEALDNLIRRST